MIKMLLIAPYEKMVEDFSRVFNQHNQTSHKAEYEVEQYSLETVVARVPEDLPDFNFNVEVVISRGLVSSGLRRLNEYIPVVEIPVAANDIVRALSKAGKINNNIGPVAVTGSPNMIMGAEDIADILGIEIKTYLIPTDEDIPLVVNQACADGAATLVGGISTTALARSMGLKSVLLESGRESIWHSITEAKRLAYLMRREEEKTARLNTVLNHSEDAIIVLDRNNTVTLLNKSAERIFHSSSQDYRNKPVEKIFPSCPDLDYLSNAVPQEAVVVEHNGLTLNISVSSLTVHNEVIGKLLTIQDISKIQELERKIREKLYEKGHVTRHSFDDIKGTSSAIRESLRIAKEYSTAESTILIIGKTGTGKELFAQSIHNESRRRNRPFIALNCAALSEHLLESELFGYSEGTFTGGMKGGKPGLFELAHLGTIFLDEISEIPLNLQAKLLRVLQEKEVRRMGDDKVIPLDVRIISAANINLYDQVEKGLFREDLLYRINILELTLPDLKERREDIPILVTSIMENLGKSRTRNISLSADALEYLTDLSWPGNIRQLRNICERLSVLYKTKQIDIEDIRKILPSPKTLSPSCDDELFSDNFLRQQQIEHERTRIVKALKEANFNKGEAASILGISRATLWRKMKSLNLEY